MIGMASLFTVAGVAGVSALTEHLLERFGHGNKVVFVKIAGYCICAYVAWDVWFDLVHYVSTMFGVRL